MNRPTMIVLSSNDCKRFGMILKLLEDSEWVICNDFELISYKFKTISSDYGTIFWRFITIGKQFATISTIVDVSGKFKATKEQYGRG